jgi:hypothetical protein
MTAVGRLRQSILIRAARWRAVAEPKGPKWVIVKLPKQSDRDQAADFHDLVAGQAKEICYVRGISLHRGKQSFLPVR